MLLVFSILPRTQDLCPYYLKTLSSHTVILLRLVMFETHKVC
jgi:hypothetical protein